MRCLRLAAAYARNWGSGWLPSSGQRIIMAFCTSSWRAKAYSPGERHAMCVCFRFMGSASGEADDAQVVPLLGRVRRKTDEGVRRVQVGGDHAIPRPAVAISEGQDGGEGRVLGLDAQLFQEASGRVAAGHPQALFLRAPLHRRERAGFGATPRVVEDALAVVERARPPYVCFDQSMGSPSTVSIEFDTTALPSPCCLMASLSKTTFDDGSLAALGSAAVLSMRGLLPRSSDTSYLSPSQRSHQNEASTARFTARTLLLARIAEEEQRRC